LNEHVNNMARSCEEDANDVDDVDDGDSIVDAVEGW
jgi:hypothetical protein